MIFKNIPIWENNNNIILQSYLLNNSTEFNQNLKRPVALVLPGGGYITTSDREAEGVALAFASRGYHAFVLRYSCGEKALMPQPILDAFKAISILRKNAEEWYIDPNRIVACGFSAGGHLASCLATMWNKPEIAENLGCHSESFKPNAVILSYPVIELPNPINEPINTGVPEAALEQFKENIGSSLEEAILIKNGMVHFDIIGEMHKNIIGRDSKAAQDLSSYSTNLLVSKDTVPSFVWTTATDELIPASSSMKYVQAMLEHGINVEFHLFVKGPHGLSLATDLTAGSPDFINKEVSVWFDMSLAWLAKTFG
ncbi:alpha/beta hydrolase [Paenibacillus albidus]|uniref:alpha/beta hydrolase n=1 Tax=Paenibacillus albidus TaxID=2041023 RepID=UPI001BE99E53|nr:alpha/beta hydrolase [Paenibacillus albidus]MBT2293479.1 alpha/beta hydrolase [Paenibacillus albidus]